MHTELINLFFLTLGTLDDNLYVEISSIFYREYK